MREQRWFAVVYMFVVTACFSSVVIGFAQFTRQDVEANQRFAFERAVLVVLPGLYESGMRRAELHRRFVEKVTKADESSAGAYTLRADGGIVAYAVPFSGQGFWAPVKGVVGIKADRRTIAGIYFYEQNETPGLGARITTRQFRDQFKGKVVGAGSQPLEFILPGHAAGDNEVHSITGATQTSIRVERMLNAALADWRSQLPGRDSER